jgi:hypothetical protein
MDGIKQHLQDALNSLDTLKSGKAVDISHLIERFEDDLNDLIRYDLDEIEKAINK